MDVNVVNVFLKLNFILWLLLLLLTEVIVYIKYKKLGEVENVLRCN